MKRNFYAIIFSVLTLASAFFAGGCGEEDAGELTLPAEIADSKPAPVPQKISTDVYFDATVSMQGYTTLSAGNVYRTLPDLLSDIGGSMGEVTFYSFGENISRIDGRDYRRFSSPDPYTEIITAVHNVIDKSDAAHLSIIVTDLFESDADWSNIAQKIREKYFAHHLAVAVIGIKNSFNGDIFDVGLNAASFRYDSNAAPERFRPFYLLILGHEETILDFMYKFRERQSLPNETQYLLLSENLTTTTSDFSKMNLLEMENFFADSKFNLDETNAREFGLDKFTEPATFSVQFDYNAPLGACPLNMNELDSSAKVSALEEGEWTPLSRNDVQITMTPAEGSSYVVKIELTPEKSLREDKINFVQASIAPTARGYLLPDWVSRWNMANVDVAPENFDGSKTINLIHVLGSLKDSVFATTHPALINLNFLIDAR
ncbi:MAG: hypothetical protein J5809_02380 [Selenomonadaceae bacterium]|nr:hypothetical protein [Selenomonadaceae bacterium]